MIDQIDTLLEEWDEMIEVQQSVYCEEHYSTTESYYESDLAKDQRADFWANALESDPKIAARAYRQCYSS